MKIVMAGLLLCILVTGMSSGAYAAGAAEPGHAAGAGVGGNGAFSNSTDSSMRGPSGVGGTPDTGYPAGASSAVKAGVARDGLQDGRPRGSGTGANTGQRQ
jgi:hypothetical protein